MRPARHTLAFAVAGLLCALGAAAPAARAASKAPDRWVGTWGAAPSAEPGSRLNLGVSDTTYREIVHVSRGGDMVRITLSNAFGKEPLQIGEVHLALRDKADAIKLSSAHALTFGGQTSVTIPPGGAAVSDSVALKLPAFSDLAISFFLPAQTVTEGTVHDLALETSYTVAGNQVSSASLNAPKKLGRWPFLTDVDVLGDGASAAVIPFGDSITDGYRSTSDNNSRWPDDLARRLAGSRKTRQDGVMNEGISGNRVLHDGAGPSALARFDRDVLSQAGARYVILLEGINDIGAATQNQHPHDVITATDLIQGLSILAARAHTRGLKVIGATLTPYVGAGYESAAGEAMRQQVNQWIRTSNQIDGVVDFDKATRDPQHPERFNPKYDSGDHLHPSDAGYKAMADAFDLKLFQEK